MALNLQNRSCDDVERLLVIKNHKWKKNSQYKEQKDKQLSTNYYTVN
jgi:hypothetical protein